MGVCQEPVIQMLCLDVFLHTSVIQRRVEVLAVFF